MSASHCVRHVVFAVAPDLVLLDACGPVEAFWRAELAMRAGRAAALPVSAELANSPHSADPCAYRVTLASVAGSWVRR